MVNVEACGGTAAIFINFPERVPRVLHVLLPLPRALPFPACRDSTTRKGRWISSLPNHSAPL